MSARQHGKTRCKCQAGDKCWSSIPGEGHCAAFASGVMQEPCSPLLRHVGDGNSVHHSGAGAGWRGGGGDIGCTVPLEPEPARRPGIPGTVEKIRNARNGSFIGLEVFINAKVLVEGLRRAGKDPTRPRFIQALESLRQFDVGGFEVNFGKGVRQGSRFVDLTIIGAGGKFTR